MRIGLLGTGKWGKHYARLIPEYGELVIMNRKIDPTVDCVVIATPSDTHFKYIKEALKANKHVLVEKPMVLSLKEAMEVKKLLRDKVFMVAHQYCYNDEVRKQRPLERISLTHSNSAGRNFFWEIAPHLFSVVDLLDFKGKVELKLVNTPEKIREWLFDNNKLEEPKTEPLRNELEHFIDCVKNSKTPLTDIEHALRVITNMEKYEIQHTM